MAPSKNIARHIANGERWTLLNVRHLALCGAMCALRNTKALRNPSSWRNMAHTVVALMQLTADGSGLQQMAADGTIAPQYGTTQTPHQDSRTLCSWIRLATLGDIKEHRDALR